MKVVFAKINERMKYERVGRTREYKTINKMSVGLSDAADRYFGEGNWEMVPRRSSRIDNVGWYAVEKDGIDTLEVMALESYLREIGELD